MAHAARCSPGALIAALLLACAGCGDAQEGTDPSAQQAQSERPARMPLAQDPRIDYLLVPGSRTEHYDVDTSDPLPILAEMLEHGQRDPLRRAREELGLLGAEGLAVARRTVDAHYENPDGGAHLRNALEVVHRSDEPGAREICLRLLRHRDIGLAALAAGALEKHGTPADYDALFRCFQEADPEFKARFLKCFSKLDPPRAQRQFLDWIERGEFQGLWDDCAPSLAAATAPDVVGRLSPLWPEVIPRFQALLAAPCARAGDRAALEFLRGEVSSSEPWRAEAAVTAMQRAGLEDELDAVARSTASSAARLRALNALATPEIAPRHAEALRRNLNSEDSALSNAALAVLVRLGEPTAIDRAMTMLAQPDNEDLRVGMEVLREALRSDPALAARALDALSRRREPEQHLPLSEQLRTLQAIGQVPLEKAARLLIELSRGARGELSGLPAERWLIQQAGNIGIPGQRVLFEELGLERDAHRRIDLLEGLAVQGGPLAVTYLLRFIESEGAQPYEVLYAADRLVRLGTVAEVAPVLKRVTLRATQRDVRIALQSMLWVNYPGPR